MVLYVVYRAPRESTGRSTIPSRLKALGCQQLHKAFWKIDEKETQRVLKVLSNNQPILLKRLREIKNPKLAKKKEFAGLGSLVLVFFRLSKDGNREKVKNFLRRAPCIRLRRSVYAFSQKQSFYDKEQKVFDALKFVNFIRDMKGEAKIISRIIVINRTSVERLLQETREHIEKESSNIVASCKELYMKARDGNNSGMLRDRFLRIKRKFSTLKKVAAVYALWLKIDVSKSIMRAYYSLRRVNSILQQD